MHASSREFQVEIDIVDPDAFFRVVRVVGEIDVATAPALRAALDVACEQARGIVVNMTDVDFIDASGISALVHAANRAREVSGRLIVHQPSRFVRKVLDILSLDDQLPIDDGALISPPIASASPQSHRLSRETEPLSGALVRSRLGVRCNDRP
jgi:anti-sigma B factor antagonist